MQYGIYSQITDSGIIVNPSEEEQRNYEEIEENFDGIFDNTVHVGEGNKEGDHSTVVKAMYNYDRTVVSGRYDVDIKIPEFNIESEVLKVKNEEIKNIYVDKLIDIIQNSKVNTIYNVSYVAYVNNNVLSLVIKSTLMSGGASQRFMYQTINYDMVNDKILTLEEVINKKGLNRDEVQKKIDNRIKEYIEHYRAVIEAGLSVYDREAKPYSYKIEDTTEFFLGDKNVLYILYPYGNTEFTSERDMVLF